MKTMIEIFFWLSWSIKDLWGTKVIYCYVLKLLFLIPQSYFPKQAATSIYTEVRGLARPCKTFSESAWLKHFPVEFISNRCDVLYASTYLVHNDVIILSHRKQTSTVTHVLWAFVKSECQFFFSKDLAKRKRN